jgi:hypothetical protein
MSGTANSSILDRIAKLLAVQEARGASENEAAIAAEHVQKLLEQHNLTLSDVERHGGASDVGKRTKDDTLRASPFQPWRVSLMEGIAKNQFCLARGQMVYENKKRKQRLLVIGREINVRTAKLTYDYLAEALLRALKEQGFKLTDQTGYSKEGSYFLEGAVERIIERLDVLRRQREAESAQAAANAKANGSGQELVLSDVYGSESDLNNDALNRYPPGTTAARRREQQEREAKQKAAHDELVGQGVDSDVAWYRAYGYSEEQATKAAQSWKRSSTRRSRSSYGGGAQNWSRRNQAHYNKITSKAYVEGSKTGKSIGLDPQVGAKSVKQIGGK